MGRLWIHYRAAYYILTVAALGTMMVVNLSVMRGMYPPPLSCSRRRDAAAG